MVHHHVCCVRNCLNNGRNGSLKFYNFPKAPWKLEQRKKWIAAVKRKNIDGSQWSPKPDVKICSAHFIGGKKAEEQASQSYIPTIFSWKNSEESQNTAFETMDLSIVNQSNANLALLYMIDEECQVDMYPELKSKETILICNRIINGDNCDAELQSEIATFSKIVHTNSPKQQDKSCSTPIVVQVDQSTTTEIKDFVGISSVKNDQQLLDLAGVSFKNFEFLSKRISIQKCTVTKKDRLLIFLMKLKIGLTFSALGVLFGVHRTTISRIFYDILQVLVSTTANLVFWPTKATVQSTMPECFNPDYSNTRVIIDCTEFRIEVPSSVDDRVLCYSHYKKGFTAKVLIGITPGGFISFKSKAAGGRKSDSQITVESGLVDLLEPGDLVLADKGFPEIKKILDASGKELTIVMPPFLTNKTEFSKEETEKTYDIARVRIHVERIMQRLRVYRVLDKIPVNIFHCIDDIVHVCCVLVNLQPPIFKAKL